MKLAFRPSFFSDRHEDMIERGSRNLMGGPFVSFRLLIKSLAETTLAYNMSCLKGTYMHAHVQLSNEQELIPE